MIAQSTYVVNLINLFKTKTKILILYNKKETKKSYRDPCSDNENECDDTVGLLCQGNTTKLCL